jgi:hypothetical protein
MNLEQRSITYEALSLEFTSGLTWSMGFVFSAVGKTLCCAFRKPEYEGFIERVAEFRPDELFCI